MQKRKQKPSQNRRPSRQRTTTSPSNAIVRVAAPIERPWELDSEAVTILKNAVAKGATDEELKYCLTVARRYRLDPFKRQIWFVSRWDRNADNGKGGTGANVWVPQVGIDGLLFMSARDHHADFGSISLPEYGPMYTPTGANFQAPEWAKVKVFKKGVAEPTEAIAYFDEYCPADFSKAPFWRKMPRRMIGKCASALALRQAYPDLGGLYIPEETEKMREDVTPSGRQIVFAEEEKPTITPEAQASIDGLKARGLWCDEHNCIRNGKHLEVCESSRKASQTQKSAEKPANMPGEMPAKAAQPSKKPDPKADEGAKDVPKAAPLPAMPEHEVKYHIELDWTDPKSPILRGQIGDLLPIFQKHLHMTRANDWWHIQPEDAKTLFEMAGPFMFQITEIQPGQVSSAAQSPKSAPAAQGKVEAPGGRRQTATPPVSPAVIDCTIERVNTGMAGKNPVKHVTVLLADRTKPTYSCFDKKWFEALDAGLGKFARLVTKQNGKYTNIIGALKIGSKEWDTDGTPVIQNKDREAGGRTLFP